MPLQIPHAAKLVAKPFQALRLAPVSDTPQERGARAYGLPAEVSNHKGTCG